VTGGRDPNGDVVLDVDYRNGCFELVLVNIGEAVAHDLRVSFSGRLIGVGGDIRIDQLNVWKRLALLRPGGEIRVFYDSAANLFRRSKNNTFSAKVAWRTAEGEHRATYNHDLEAYRDLPEMIDLRDQ
jgi:hypothetical protein